MYSIRQEYNPTSQHANMSSNSTADKLTTGKLTEPAATTTNEHDYTFNTLFGKGLSLDKLGNHTGAIDPHDVDALNYKGVALKSLGNYTGAILYYDKILAIDPKNETTLYNKAPEVIERMYIPSNRAWFQVI
jgi:lipoprotein NlpI